MVVFEYRAQPCPPRSSYFNLLRDTFLPPILPLPQTSSSVKIPEKFKDGSKQIFPSLFVSLKMDASNLFLERNTNPLNKQIPYDFFVHPFKEFSWIAHAKYPIFILLVKLCREATLIQKCTLRLSFNPFVRLNQPEWLLRGTRNWWLLPLLTRTMHLSIGTMKMNWIGIVRTESRISTLSRISSLCSIQDNFLIPWEEFEVELKEAENE